MMDFEKNSTLLSVSGRGISLRRIDKGVNIIQNHTIKILKGILSNFKKWKCSGGVDL